jgi:hypothetical protein
MTKDIKQIQEHNSRAIICAVHNTKDYEKALRQEGNHCLVCEGSGNQMVQIGLNIRGVQSIPCQSCFGLPTGKPLTLDRVLLALPNYSIFNMLVLENSCKIRVFVGLDKNIKDVTSKEASIYEEVIWNLTKPTLEEQTEETQLAIAKLTGYNINN